MRMVPRQAPVPLVSGVSTYGFLFEGRIMQWSTMETARVAAYCLGVDQDHVLPVQTWYPSPQRLLDL